MGDLNHLLSLVALTITSLLYTYYIASKIPKGLLRLLSILPVFVLLFIIPFNIHSFHIGASAWSYIGWYCNLKLLLFAFDQGPLPSSHGDLLLFLLLGAFPFKIKQTKSKSISKLLPSSVVEASKKATLLGILFHCYEYQQWLHPHVLLMLYFFHTYLTIQLLLAVGAIPAQIILGVEVEPQFNAPLLSTSLQDFWGRRWNRRVSDLHRETVYSPVRSFSKRVIGDRWASLPAVFATFVYSGLMHEALYYHVTRQRPTWEVTWFFILQGVLVDIEIVLKKKLVNRNKFRLHSAISGPLALLSIAITAGWLSYTQIRRNGSDEKIIKEFHVFVDFLKGKTSYLLEN